MIKLINDDCIIAMNKLIDDGVKVDMILTSPPYDNLRTYEDTLVWNEDIWKQVIFKCFDILKDSGVMVWVVGDATIKGSETGTSFKQALYAKEVGFNLHDTMIYQKKSCYAHDLRNKRYKHIFEYMFVLSKGTPKTYNEIKDEPVLNYGKIYSGGKGRNKNGELRKSRSFSMNEFQARYNIWRISTDHRSMHPAIFPEKLAYDHIVSWSNENDLILDPFMGSGTTGKVAKELNRNFIGIELVEQYFNIAKDRINTNNNLFS